MRAEIVGVGTEILLGQICNDNAQWMSQELAEIGVDLMHHQAVGDNKQRIADCLRLALSRADVVLVTGGLGPTQDDITREGLADALGVGLVRLPEIEDFLRERFRRFGRVMAESNLQQADVPEGGRTIMPQRGTAPGLICETAEGKRVYVVPGVPAEMREMMTSTILPELKRLAGPATIVSRTLKVTGIPESTVAEMLDDLFHASTNPSVAYLANSGEVKVRLTAKASDRGAAEALIDPLAIEVQERLGAAVFTTHDEDLADVVARELRARGQTLACAESLTGGSLAARLTAAAGASDHFVGSAVVYTAQAKMAVLGVSAETIEREGVVSEACAIEMAAGALRLYGVDVAVALTGVAGPDAHGGKDPGTVCIGLVAKGVEAARTGRAPGDRLQVRRWSEQIALDMLRRHLSGLPIVP